MPEDAGYHLERARALHDEDRAEEAADECRQAIALEPGLAAAHNLLGWSLSQLGDHAGALAVFEEALRIEPGFVHAHCNLGLELLFMGDYARGWQEFEWRWQRPEYQPIKSLFTRTWWDGSDPRGKTLLLFAEQGLGDAIQFVRYAPIVAAMGAQVVLDCHPPLKGLLREVAGVTRVLESDAEIAGYGLCAPLMSLPRLLGTTARTVPATIPYLGAPVERCRLWGEKLASFGDGFRVGLAWASSAGGPAGWRRSVPLDVLAPLGRIDGIKLFSLQIGSQHGDASQLVGGLPLHDMTEDLYEFRDTAAFMANLDLVISVDTVFAHLAGALGRPTWVLLSDAADWRWQGAEDRTPWYPATRLFRRRGDEAWDDVAERLAGELRRLARQERAARP